MRFSINKLSGFRRADGKGCPSLAGILSTGPAQRDLCHGRQRARAALRRVGAALLFLAMTATAAHADPMSELARARHDLAISEQVLDRVSVQAERARSDPATGPQERQRLDEYLAHVRELVAQNRKRVRALEESVRLASAGLPGAGSGAAGASGATTNAEEVAALDARLGGSLAEFDKLLLEEARKAQARAPASGSSGGGYAGGSSRKAEAQGAQQADGNGARAGNASTSADGNTEPQQTGAGPGSPGGRIDGTDPGAPGPTAAVPPDVGDGSDDDIVARQIRRAAETEKDPELREKLWDEYRKYKQGTKG